MRHYKLEEKSLATAQKVWMGIDAHKKTLHITVLAENGDKLFVGSLPHERAHLAGLVRRLEGCEITAVYEAGPTGYKLLQWLQELGCQAFMTPPTHVRQRKGGKRVKTDARDSFDLAEQARAGMLPQVHALDEVTYRARQVSRTRAQLVEHRSALKTQIKSMLLAHGVRAPDELKTAWSRAYFVWLRSGPSGDENLDLALVALVEAIDAISVQIKRLEARLAQLERSERWAEKARLVRSVPGVGPVTVMVLLLEMGDVERFDRCEEFASWLGLVPCEWSSGDAQNKGSITRAGNRRIRSALVESSWYLIGKDARMRNVYERIKAKSGSGKAIVAVARRLALAIRAILREKTPYQYDALAA